MAYQPIQMPQEQSTFLDSFNTGLGQAHKQRADEEAQKRQEQQDFQATFLKAKQLAEGGDMAGAQALMAPYKSMLAEQGGGPPPPAPMQAPEPPKPPQGGSPLPDSMEFGNNPASDFDMDHGQPAAGQPAAAMAPPPAPPAALPEPIEPPGNPVLAARQAQLAQQQQGNQQRARTVLNFTGPGGVAGSIDPEAGRKTAMERKAQMLDSALATVKDPEIQAEYARMRPGLMMSPADVDPADVFRALQGEVNAKRQAAAAEAADRRATARDDQFKQLFTQRGELAHDRIEAGHENARIGATARTGAASIVAQPEVKQGNAATAVAGRFDGEFDKWQKQQGWGTVRTGSRALHAAMANIDSGNPLAEKDAQIQLARFLRGTVTEGEMHILYNNLAGKLGNAWGAFSEKMMRGGLSPAEKNILSEAIDVSKQEQAENVGNIIASARETFGPGSGHENMAGNVNHKVRGLFQGVGVKSGDVFEPQGGNPLPTVTLGKGNPMLDPEARHPAVGARAAQKSKAPAGNPVVEAAAVAKLPPADQDKARAAMARLAKNPGDAVAKKWLQFHGLQQ
jgi:hypothetical protein